MRYVMIFLAVLVVLLLMIAFMFLVIRQVSDRVTGQVNGRYMRELSVFDRLYEEKKKKLEELEEKERLYGVNLMKKDAPAKNPAKVQTVAETPAAGLELPPASTGQTDFGEAYRNVRNEFAVDRSAEIRGILSLDPGPMAETGKAAGRILTDLPLETAYSLSTLDPEEQEQILRQCLDEEELKILEQYLDENGTMDACGFREYASVFSDLYSDKTTVYTGNPESAGKTGGSRRSTMKGSARESALSAETGCSITVYKEKQRWKVTARVWLIKKLKRSKPDATVMKSVW